MQKLQKTQTVAKNKGFTLVELLTAVVIIAILGSIALPLIMSWLPNMRLKAAARDIYSTMQKTKSEAIQRNNCISTTFTTVTFPAIGGGYTSFIDDGTGSGTICNGIQDGGEVTLFSTVTMPQNVSLISADSIGGPQAVCFNGKSLVCGSQSGNIVLRNNQSRWFRVRVQAAGVIMAQTSPDGTATSWN